MKIVWTRRAGASLDREWTYIARDDPKAARRVAARIIEATQRLTEQPNMGRPGRVPGTRELVVPGTPYIVPYRLEGGTVQILHVLHATRKWPEGFKD